MLTIDRILEYGPCKPYDRDYLLKLFGKEDNISAADILALDISDSDKLFALLRPEILGNAGLLELKAKFLATIDSDYAFYDKAQNDDCFLLTCHCVRFQKKSARTAEDRQALLKQVTAWCMQQAKTTFQSKGIALV